MKLPPRKNISEVKTFFRNKGLVDLLRAAEEPQLKTNQLTIKKAYRPELIDLYNLYQLIVLNKRITTLEFGCGWSSLIISLALQQNKKNYMQEIGNLRRNNPFQNFVVDNEKKYLNIAKKRILKFNKSLIKDSFFLYSKVNLLKHDFRYVTEYEVIPKINPDFIYLDAPDQFQVTSIEKFNTNHNDLVPMSADILKIEFFLNNGTIILVDGRALNVNFLQNYLKRNWKYKYIMDCDQHIFYLNEKNNGIHSKNLLKFFNRD